jgi:hypothetical protein
MHATFIQRLCAARASALVALALGGVGNAIAATPLEDWSFTVRLDGKPIGTHRFVLTASGAGQNVNLSSEARFDVSLFGVPLFRYRHRVSERWVDGCLASIDAQTDDNGEATELRGRRESGRFALLVRKDGRSALASDEIGGCLMSFAYWNPALAAQTRLLDAGSGRVEPVAIEAVTKVPADLMQAVTPARGLRIVGLTHPIDVWYEGDRWVGLDTEVAGGRRLSYRLN